MSTECNALADSKNESSAKASDEVMRKLLKPLVTSEQVVAILKADYASEGEPVSVLSVLDSYDDMNFMVQIGMIAYLFKVHNGVESNDYRKVLEGAGGDFYRKGEMRSVIHLQTAMMHVLKLHKIPSNVPVDPINSNMGSRVPPVTVHELPVVSADHSPCHLVCRLLTWLPGRPMSSLKVLPLAALADAGRFLGRMDRALDQLVPEVCGIAALRRVESSGLRLTGMSSSNPSLNMNDNSSLLQDASVLIPARRYHQWDGKNTADLSKFVRFIKDERRRSLVKSVLYEFQKDILDSGDAARFRKAVIHGDFNDANIIMDDDFGVAGVVDFGDSVESWRILDVSVGMAYAMLSTYGKANCSISAAAALLRGYNSIYPLDSLERKHLLLLMASRLACSVTIGAYSYQQNPGNHYLLLHAEPAWKALELIWSYDHEQRVKMSRAVSRVFDQACLYTDSRDQIINCHDLVFPDPNTADLLHSVRVPSDCPPEPPKKKLKMNERTVLTFVTGNPKKLEEVQRILGINGATSGEPTELPFKLTNINIDLPELQGQPIHVASQKCTAAVQKVKGPVIIEDTSLCFNALSGMPGVYIKWFLESCGHEGLNKMLSGFEDKTAYAQTVVAFCPGPGKEIAVFDGRTDGKIVMPRGDLAFGWDPIFEPIEGDGKTYAEMNKDEKDSISHRSRAFQKLRNYLVKFKGDILHQMEGTSSG